MAIRLKQLHTVLLVASLLWTGVLSAHGLQMTTAHVVQRQDNYLYITIETSVTELFNHMAYQGKPASLVHLANGSDVQLEGFRQALLGLFHQQLSLSVADRPLQSVQVRTLSVKQLRQLLQGVVAESVLNATVKQSAHHSERENYLRIEVDGFIAAETTERVLQANFPKALGEMMVSYTRPAIQTIAPTEQGSHYVQPLQK